MKLKIMLFAAAVSGPLAVGTQASQAAETGWLNGYDSGRAFLRDIKRDQQIPTRIRCRDVAGRKSLDKRAIEINLSYRPNPKKYGWAYAWGQSFGKAAKEYPAPKWRLVSQDSFRRASGLVARCGIWHRVS